MADWIEVLIRTISLFFIVLAVTRIMGKRQLTRLTPFHFVSYFVVGILAVLIAVNLIDNLILGFLALATWVTFYLVLDYLALKSKMIHDWINGRETVLIKDGKVMEDSLKQLRLTGEELLRDLRTKNAFNLADVEFAVMETTGELNVLLKSDKKPVTPSDLGKRVAPKSAPQTVILDGNILDEPLSNIGLNRGWLDVEIKKLGLSLDNIFIGQVDSSGDLYVDLFDDAIQIPQPKVKEALYASLQKCQSDLVKYGLETQDSSAKDMYQSNANKLKDLMEILKPYLLR
ncbi:uncharacterized membrane protein YcaP (DUF421 family) [Orenia metallireducens]|uniref:Uncharacterized membrane protein YcaP, DUF421 family n=1 Tax=Orenia metallireducens TaxID=1413210 RepID=A0A285GSS5_9FIRM|nr:DUF421 domain-containing protein [Orenia metallireducens]PRX32623.1 uncharacterized membrane protein YcaP (DUF421 family) [Orenia metallireducens]SNY26535.1 Uncharacterized membrane protein YcaP, DUF421 family [Orenia metallireducens]